MVIALTPWEYPIQLSLAYLFLVGYFFRTAFLSFYLPGAVGVIVSGFVFSFFIQTDILAGRDTLQGLSFFLVLLTAGFEISLSDLKPYILIYSLLPSTMELCGIAYYATAVMGYSTVEGLVLGCALFCVGDGLVIPRMMELTRQFPGHPMPRFVFMSAPLEASFALTLFGVLAGLAEPANNPDVQIVPVVIANILRIVATLLFGAVVGTLAGRLISSRMNLKIKGLPVFTGAPVEAYLMILAVALAGFGLGAEYHDKVVLPIGFSPGSLFQPELLVIVIGAFFAHSADPELLHDLESIVAGVWVFGQLILFSMLGSKTDVSVFSYVPQVLPLMFVGLPLRFLGMFVATYVTLPIRPCNCLECRTANKDSAVPDAVFCFLSMLPRATIQGALGPIAVIQKFFSKDGNGEHVEAFIAAAARLYIVCMAIGGSVLLDLWGPRMLEAANTRSQRCSASKIEEEQAAEECWERQRSWSSIGGEMEMYKRPHRKESELSNTYSTLSTLHWGLDTDCPEVSAAMGTLAEAFNVEGADVARALKKLKRANGSVTPPSIKPNLGDASVPGRSLLGIPSSQASHRNRSRSDMAGQGLSRSVSGSVSNRLERRRSISEDVVENFRNAQPRPQRTVSSNLHRTTSGSLRPQGSRRRTISDDMREGWPHQRLRKGSGFAGVAMFEARPVPEEPVYLSSDSSGDDIGDRPGFGSPPTIHVLNMDNQVVEEGDESHHELDDRPDAGV